jgi:hypothetical protein
MPFFPPFYSSSPRGNKFILLLLLLGTAIKAEKEKEREMAISLERPGVPRRCVRNRSCGINETS